MRAIPGWRRRRLFWTRRLGLAEGAGVVGMAVERCPKCGKPLSHYEDREVRVRWCGYPEPHYWDWQLKVPKLQLRP